MNDYFNCHKVALVLAVIFIVTAEVVLKFVKRDGLSKIFASLMPVVAIFLSTQLPGANKDQMDNCDALAGYCYIAYSAVVGARILRRENFVFHFVGFCAVAYCVFIVSIELVTKFTFGRFDNPVFDVPTTLGSLLCAVTVAFVVAKWIKSPNRKWVSH